MKYLLSVICFLSASVSVGDDTTRGLFYWDSFLTFFRIELLKESHAISYWDNAIKSIREGRVDVDERAESMKIGGFISFKEQTFLTKAINEGREDVVDSLIELGADVNLKDGTIFEYGDAPLHLAAEGGREDLVERLIEAGAEVNATSDEDEATALVAAIDEYEAHEGTVRKLMDAGADIPCR